MLGQSDPTTVKIKRSAEDEQGLRHMHRTEGKPDPAFDKPAGHVADPESHVYGAGTGAMHRPAVVQEGTGEGTREPPEPGIGTKVVDAAKSALGMGTGPSSEKAE